MSNALQMIILQRKIETYFLESWQHVYLKMASNTVPAEVQPKRKQLASQVRLFKGFQHNIQGKIIQKK